MIKYIPQDTQVVFEEIPDEATLAINISNCQNKCIGCHSPYLRQNIGEELNFEAIDGLIEKNGGITCICFLGEGNDAEALKNTAFYLKEKYPKLKRAIYSGRAEVEGWYYTVFDYIKIGAYIEEYGPLNKKTTNQRLLEINQSREPISSAWHIRDITYKFWK